MIGPLNTKQTEWSRERTFGGSGLTSWRSGKKIAATDQCVALILVCPRCYERFVSTPEQPRHCPPEYVMPEHEAVHA
jgi:hypothetical protein